jgi:hypothetical protein
MAYLLSRITGLSPFSLFVIVLFVLSNSRSDKTIGETKMINLNIPTRYDITDRLKIEKYGNSYCAYIWYPGSVLRNEPARYVSVGTADTFQGALNLLLTAYGYPVVVESAN